jgi:ribosomal protein S18 acetylase RimI-like enzyme
VLLEFKIIEDLESDDFKNAVKIYVNSFPPHETRPVERVKELLATRKYKLFVVKNPSVLAIAFVYFFENFGFLDYMAVKTDYQRQGIGGKFYQHLSNILKNDNYDFLLFEIQKPENNKSDRIDRIRFYQKLGTKLVIDNYLMPAYNSEPELMFLMIDALKNQTSISKSDLEICIKKIYADVYDDPHLELLDKMMPVWPENILFTEISYNHNM